MCVSILMWVEDEKLKFNSLMRFRGSVGLTIQPLPLYKPFKTPGIGNKEICYMYMYLGQYYMYIYYTYN